MKLAQPADLLAIAACHMKAFPESITSLLGKSVVADMFKWYLSAPNKFLVWVEENGKCIGYCGGVVLDGTDAYGSASGMTQFGMQAGMKRLLLKPWLLFHPEIRKRYPFMLTNIKRKVKRLFSSTTATTVKPIERTVAPSELKSGLVVIGVDPNYQGKGLGSLLQHDFEQRSKQLGAIKMELSVRQNNQQAITSYERNGWSISGTEGPSYNMVKLITP